MRRSGDLRVNYFQLFVTKEKKLSTKEHEAIQLQRTA